MDKNTDRFSRANLMLRQVSVTGFGLIFSPGSGAGAAGMLRLVR